MDIKIDDYKGFKAECWFDGMYRYCVDSECGDIHIEVEVKDKDTIQSKFEKVVDEKLKWLGHDEIMPKYKTKIFSRDFKRSVIVSTYQPLTIGDVVRVDDGNPIFFIKITEKYNNNECAAFVGMHYNHKPNFIKRLLGFIGW